ncbi:HEAT repeat domain-containing protein [Marinicella meishanensis]|uniref:HEAT repeat domain-containing protein n=1 Tax=Marinicella meishanensis TaxID=2873263 RepID=UPI001CBDA3A1|nr:HEAT repeat domain-containing protein [Marinicella sp. NBU2979]
MQTIHLTKAFKSMALGFMLCSHTWVMAQSADALEAYELGQVSMQSKDWRDAIEAFEEAAKDRKLQAAAQYWQGYAHYQVKQRAQARRLLERLIRNHPNSDWADDAQVLLFEHGDSDEQGTHQAALDEELKLFTLQQIMFNNPEKALPKVYDMLEQSNSERVKMNAIQLLGISDSEAVVDYLFRYIGTEQNQGLQHQAIQMLSLRDGIESRKKLLQLYENSQSRDLKAAIIQGFIHHDDSDELIALLKKESDPDLNVSLIRMLGIKGESAALKDLYQKSQGDSRRAILEALALSGDAAYLYYVIDNEKDPSIRTKAIQSLVMVDDDNMGDYLARLYQKATDESEKDAITGVFIATDVDPQVVIDIFQQENSTERKQSLLSTLMAMDEVDGLRQVYDTETDPEIKSAIIRLFGVMDATDVLMGLYEADPELANDRSLFEAFGMSSSELNVDFLMDRFKEGDAEVKQGVLHALMMQGNADAMVQLLKQETDHEVKKMIIKTIGITDPDALIDAIED